MSEAYDISDVKLEAAAAAQAAVDTQDTTGPFGEERQHVVNESVSVVGVGSGNASEVSPPATSHSIRNGITKPPTGTKRAEQNRAAQRAFRARRKTRIQDLERLEQTHQACGLEKQELHDEINRLKSQIVDLQTELLKLKQ
ncbi:hypothetical protein DAMA08_016110 [Martiniozyma asiatica (nom. inval.)]|nr:hypothetical protein DAMA08_016110 [Martiniozyma asiatica]